MAGLDLSMIFDCDPENLPLASSGPSVTIAEEDLFEVKEASADDFPVKTEIETDDLEPPVATNVPFVDEILPITADLADTGYNTTTTLQVTDENPAERDDSLDSENDNLFGETSSEEDAPIQERMRLSSSSEEENYCDVDYDDLDDEYKGGNFMKEFLFYKSPEKEPAAQTSTPKREPNNQESFSWTQSTINPGPSSQIAIKKKQLHPPGWSLPKKRRISETLATSNVGVFTPPTYKTTTHTSGFVSHLREMEFLLGDGGNDLPGRAQIPDTEVTEDDVQVAAQLKEMMRNGDVDSWEKLVGNMRHVRGKYSKEDEASYFHDRRRIMDRLKLIHESLEKRPGPTEMEATPRGMIKELKEHQKHGLKFMLWRETQDPCGGILADDMGLGKTMSIVALVRATLNTDPVGNMQRPRGVKYTGGTLVICPASITSQWADEFNDSSNGIRVYVHHTESKIKKPEELLGYDVVVTSYGKVANEMTGGKSLLFQIFWKRIVLDEAHTIRNWKTQASEATCTLHGKLRWLLTGTPIHNRIDDIYPYLRFLRCYPFDELTIFRKWAKDSWSDGHRRLNVLLKALMIRRTKEELNLVPSQKIMESFEYDLEEKESACYQRLMSLSAMMMKVFLNNRAWRRGEEILYDDENVHKVRQIMQRRMNGIVNFNNLLVLLLRLRQLCSHPVLVRSMLNQETQAETVDDEIDGFREEDANVMGQIVNDAIDDKEVFDLKNEIFDEFRPSTKIRMMMHILQERFVHTKDKALIVCEWPSYLRIIADHLTALSLSFEYYTGKTDIKERAEIVKRFNSDVMNPRILLLSIKAGGIGLNLVRANHIFLLCTHWNPQIERQAEDRCYRIGQEKDVHIYKFRCQGSIEERIFQLQQNKLKIADDMLSGATGNNYQLTIKDLKSLFGL